MISDSGEYVIRRPIVWLETPSSVGTFSDMAGRETYEAIATGPTNVELRDRRPEELARLLKDLEAHSFRGWDGYTAQPVTEETRGAVEDLLVDLIALDKALPDTAPAVDGSVCMEWYWLRGDLEEKIFVDIGPGSRVMSLVDVESGSEEKHFATYGREAKDYILSLFDKIVC